MVRGCEVYTCSGISAIPASEEVPMHRVNWKPRNVTFLACLFSIALFLATGCLAPVVVEAQQPASVTVFEGARLIVGDGSAPVADSAFIVENGRFTAVGRKGQQIGRAHV